MTPILAVLTFASAACSEHAAHPAVDAATACTNAAPEISYEYTASGAPSVQHGIVLAANGSAGIAVVWSEASGSQMTWQLAMRGSDGKLGTPVAIYSGAAVLTGRQLFAVDGGFVLFLNPTSGAVETQDLDGAVIAIRVGISSSGAITAASPRTVLTHAIGSFVDNSDGRLAIVAVDVRSLATPRLVFAAIDPNALTAGSAVELISNVLAGPGYQWAGLAAGSASYLVLLRQSDQHLATLRLDATGHAVGAPSTTSIVLARLTDRGIAVRPDASVSMLDRDDANHRLLLHIVDWQGAVVADQSAATHASPAFMIASIIAAEHSLTVLYSSDSPTASDSIDLSRIVLDPSGAVQDAAAIVATVPVYDSTFEVSGYSEGPAIPLGDGILQLVPSFKGSGTVYEDTRFAITDFVICP